MPPKQSSTKTTETPVKVTPAVMFKLGGMVTDTASDMKGMITLMEIGMDFTHTYCFQPKGLDKETREPIKMHWIVPTRIKGGEVIPLPSDLPLHILGTQVEDTATGFKGTAIGLVLFMSGCIHVNIQPQGERDKNGGMVRCHDFDIRRLTGPAIKKMTDDQKEKDKKEKPSPMEIPSRERSTPGAL